MFCKDQITGTLVNYYVTCKREAWLYAHHIHADQEDENVLMGKALADIKELEKELALYTIAVGKNMLGNIKSYTREFFGRYILAPSDFYDKFDGFLPELTAVDEVFD